MHLRLAQPSPPWGALLPAPQAAEAFEAALDLGLDSAGTNEAHTGVVRALLAAQEWQRAVNRAREAVQEDQTNRVFRQVRGS